jgi:hypothetical protein
MNPYAYCHRDFCIYARILILHRIGLYKPKEIVGLARKENMIGKSLLLYCQNHPTDKGITATTANDFKKAPEGGCMKPCEFKLRCGRFA